MIVRQAAAHYAALMSALTCTTKIRRSLQPLSAVLSSLLAKSLQIVSTCNALSHVARPKLRKPTRLSPREKKAVKGNARSPKRTDQRLART